MGRFRAPARCAGVPSLLALLGTCATRRCAAQTVLGDCPSSRCAARRVA